MSLFIAGAIAGVGLIVGLLVAMSEQIRAKLRWRDEFARERQQLEDGSRQIRLDPAESTAKVMPQRQVRVRDAATVSPISRAAAYREILDALGDDLDQDIAEWEAVLQDFPQVIGAEEILPAADQSLKPTKFAPEHEEDNAPHRTRRLTAEERGMIARLLNTGFAPEEIALWLNLPLERVQEFLPRD